MSKIEQKDVRDVLRIISNINVRKILHILDDDMAFSYTDLQKFLGTSNEKALNSGLVAHYIRELMRHKLILKDEELRLYYLSSRGIEVLKLVDQFEKWYTTYDMSDVNSEGKIERFAMIVRHVRKRRKEIERF